MNDTSYADDKQFNLKYPLVDRFFTKSPLTIATTYYATRF
jgi:hypothetical protein